MNKQRLKTILVGLILLAPCSLRAQNQFGVVGAGNATCQYWAQADANQKMEVFSWMKGFASSESLSRAHSNEDELRLEMLSNNYLNYEIETACADPANSSEKMSSILLEILATFPLRAEQ